MEIPVFAKMCSILFAFYYLKPLNKLFLQTMVVLVSKSKYN